jgi:uncharacterized protein (TIGR02391 family)
MLSLSADQIEALPVDQLGIAILEDMAASRTWNDSNYLIEARQWGGMSQQSLEAVSEAIAWLRARALIARTPGQSSESAIFITRTGRRVLAEGIRAFQASERLQGGSHPLIESKVRPQFLIGAYELGVFAAMKAVEVRVRRLGGFGDDLVGVDLMNKAFNSTGPLTDKSSVKAEQEGVRALFAGAYAVFRNPSGHRDVNFDDVSEAAEMVQTASLLMRMLDRIEKRHSSAS